MLSPPKSSYRFNKGAVTPEPHRIATLLILLMLNSKYTKGCIPCKAHVRYSFNHFCIHAKVAKIKKKSIRRTANSGKNGSVVLCFCIMQREEMCWYQLKGLFLNHQYFKLQKSYIDLSFYWRMPVRQHWKQEHLTRIRRGKT